MWRFEPDPSAARREAILTVLAALLVAPLYFWWRGFSDILAGVLVTLFAVAVLAGRALWLLSIRGLDTIAIDEDGVQLSCKRRTASFRWVELHRVYRFGENLVFESTPPHRRYNFMLAGHEAHEKKLIAALTESARTMDLRWLSELT